MKQSFLKELKNLQTFTLSDLQTKLKNDHKSQGAKPNSPQAEMNRTSTDLNIVSPFYKRIIHKPDCTCKYHKRQRFQAPKIKKKVKTEPKEALPTIRASIPQEGNPREPSHLDALFENWRELLGTDDLKNYYFEYLKTLPTFDKIKRLDKLDCHNVAFEEFLKKNYLVILQRQKNEEKANEREMSVRHIKSSKKMLQKMYTEGNIDYDALSEFNVKRVGFSYKDTSKFNEKSLTTGQDLSKETLKLKKIGIKGNGKTLEFIDQQQIKQRKEDGRRKKAKFANNRPSFFGLIEEQQILKQLCHKLMTENKRLNKEADVIVKQMVDSDVDMYSKMMGEIQEDLEAGIKLRNLNADETRLLVKIVLNKIQKHAHGIRSKDQQHERKASLIDNICNRYGWPKDDKVMQLKEFWKMRHQKHSSGLGLNLNRNSVMNPMKHAVGRQQIDSKDNKESKKSIKSKAKIKEDTRMSGLNSEKGQNQNKVKQQNSGKFVDSQHSNGDSVGELPSAEEFKFMNSKMQLSKMGVFSRKGTNGVSFSNDELNSHLRGTKKMFGSSFKPSFPKEDYEQKRQEMDDIVIELTSSRTIIKDLPSSSHSQQSRNSSIYINLKNQVQNHIETNKRFLKRIQHDLIDNQCERLIIGMGEGIITKKRKIRAIHQALQTETIKKSDYYHDILKYLEIYQDYCDLIIKNRKERRTRMGDPYVSHRIDHGAERRMKDEQMEIDGLLEALNNQRELKYIRLNILTEEEDPKDQLILKIPQYITIKIPPRVRRHYNQLTMSDRGGSSLDSNRSISPDRIRQDFNVIQKDLGETVMMQCNNNWSVAQLQEEVDGIQPSLICSPSDFQKKIQRLRAAFKLGQRK